MDIVLQVIVGSEQCRFIIKSLQTFYLCPKLNELKNVIQFSQDKSEKAKFHTFSINCFICMVLPLNVSRMRQPFVFIFLTSEIFIVQLKFELA